MNSTRGNPSRAFDRRFAMRVRWKDGSANVALGGELDMATRSVLDERLAALWYRGPTAIVVDLRDVTFLDSSGLHLLLDARARGEADGRRLAIRGARPSVRRVFELTGSTFLLEDDGFFEVA